MVEEEVDDNTEERADQEKRERSHLGSQRPAAVFLGTFAVVRRVIALAVVGEPAFDVVDDRLLSGAESVLCDPCRFGIGGGDDVPLFNVLVEGDLSGDALHGTAPLEISMSRMSASPVTVTTTNRGFEMLEKITTSVVSRHGSRLRRQRITHGCVPACLEAVSQKSRISLV